jgi:hypothetical protein
MNPMRTIGTVASLFPRSRRRLVVTTALLLLVLGTALVVNDPFATEAPQSGAVADNLAPT